jgi:hypothetical protein
LGTVALATAVYWVWQSRSALADWAEMPTRQVLRVVAYALGVLATVEFALRIQRRPIDPALGGAAGRRGRAERAREHSACSWLPVWRAGGTPWAA